MSALFLRSLKQRLRTILSPAALAKNKEIAALNLFNNTNSLKNGSISSNLAKHPNWSTLLSTAPVATVIDANTPTNPAAAPVSETVAASSEFMPVEEVQRILCMIHEHSGLPWWAALIIAAVGFRTLVVPFSLIRMRATASLVRFMPYIMTQLRLGGLLNNLPRRLVQRPLPYQNIVPVMLKLYKKQSKKFGVSVWRMFSPLLISVPLFVTFNLAVRRMMNKYHAQVAADKAMQASSQIDANVAAATPLPTGTSLSSWTDDAVAKAAMLLQTEGPWFCPNLTLPDPNFIFPGIAIVVTMANVYATFNSFSDLKIQMSDKVAVNVESLKPSKASYLMLSVQGLVMMVIPLASWMPAYTFLYWNTVMVYSTVQNILLKSPAVRRFCGFEEPHYKVAPEDLSFLHSDRPPVVVALPPLSGRAVSTAQVAHEVLMKDAQRDAVRFFVFTFTGFIAYLVSGNIVSCTSHHISLYVALSYFLHSNSWLVVETCLRRREWAL